MGLIPLINGRSYAWADITFNVGGYSPAGITKVNYSDDQVKENNYGQGSKPVSRAYGRESAESSITLHAEEVEALTANAPDGDIKRYGPFDLIVQFMVGTQITKHVIHNCEFTRNSRDLNEGDTKIEVDLPLICSHISWK